MEFGLNKRDEKVFEMIKATKSRGKHSLRNSWLHLERAWAIRTFDPAMAALRGITAEEEAATGIIHAVQDRGYDNANQLNRWKHAHKHSIHPFFLLLSDFYARSIRPVSKGIGIKLGSIEDPKRLKIYIRMEINGKEYDAMPDPPLNLNIKVEGKPISFKQQVDQLASIKNVKRIEKYIDEKANERNLLLYASDKGCPHLESIKNLYFFEQKKKVMTMAYAYLLIEPYKEKQPFVQQCLDALLRMLGKVKSPHLHDEV